MALACGRYVTAAVTEAGGLFTWGRNTHGQLGLAHWQQQPTLVGGLGQLATSRVLMAAAGDCHQAAVLEDRSICTWGCGENGRLGHGDEHQQPSPVRMGREVFAGSPVIMVACGRAHTVVVTAAGRVWTCGANGAGQLGHSDTADRLVFTLVRAERFEETRIVMAACGCNHTAVVTAEGRVWTWGCGYPFGCLGHNDEQNRPTPTLLAAEQLGGSTIVMVAAGSAHTVAVDKDGAPWVWGYGGFGELGLGDTAGRRVPTQLGTEAFGGSRVHMAACGSYHTLFLTREGGLWACGLGLNQQRGYHNVRHILSFLFIQFLLLLVCLCLLFFVCKTILNGMWSPTSHREMN